MESNWYFDDGYGGCQPIRTTICLSWLSSLHLLYQCIYQSLSLLLLCYRQGRHQRVDGYGAGPTPSNFTPLLFSLNGGQERPISVLPPHHSHHQFFIIGNSSFQMFSLHVGRPGGIYTSEMYLTLASLTKIKVSNYSLLPLPNDNLKQDTAACVVV